MILPMITGVFLLWGLMSVAARDDHPTTGLPADTPVQMVEGCSLCVFSSEPAGHRWPLNGEHYCNSPEEQEENNCAEIPAEEHQGDTFWSGSCPTGCGINLMKPSDMMALLAALDANDVGTVQEYIDRYPESVTFDRSRSAIQVLGCEDLVIAHLPVGGAVVQPQLTDM